MYRQKFIEQGFDIPSSASARCKIRCHFCQHTRSAKNRNDKPLSVDLINGVYKCHHCDAKGKIQMGNEKQYNAPTNLPTGISKAVVDYFKGRSIKESTLTDLGIGSIVNRNMEYIAFNYYDENNTHVNIKYRNVSDKKDMRQLSGAKPSPYNARVIRNAPYILITEGEIDVASWVEAGVLYTISGQNGANDNWVTGLYDELDKLEKIYIAVDNDDKGIAYKNALARRFDRSKLFIVDYGIYNDANEVLVNEGAASLRQLFESAEPFPIEGISRVNSFADDAMKFFVEGYPDTYDSGLISLDKYFTVNLGDITIVTGTPGAGKSNFVDYLAVQYAKRHNFATAFYSGEKTPKIHLTNLVYKYIAHSRDTLDPNSDSDKSRFLNGINFLQDYIFYLSEQENKPETLIEKASYLVKRFNIRILVIDNWTTMDTTSPANVDTRDYFGQILSKFTSFAKKFECHVFIVVHPRKLQKKDDGRYVMPTGYDLYSSSHFYNLTDNGISLRKDDNHTDVQIWKVRHQEFVGSEGFFKVRFDRASGGNYYDSEQVGFNNPTQIYADKYGQKEDDIPF